MSITKGKIIGLIMSFVACIILIVSGIFVLNPPSEDGESKNPSTTTNTLYEGSVYSTTLTGNFETVKFTPSYSNTFLLYVDGCFISSIKTGTTTISLTNYDTDCYMGGTYYDYKYAIRLTGGKTYTIKTTSGFNKIKLYIC